MRYSPQSIQNFLAEYSLSNLTVADFCARHDLKVPTFYTWKRKYLVDDNEAEQGFCEIMPRAEGVMRSLILPSGLRIDLIGLTTSDIAELILEIDRAHA